MERVSVQYLRLFIDQAPVSIAMFDRGMRYLAASDHWLNQHWISDRHIIGRSHYDVVPEIPERWKVVHQRGLAGEFIREDEDAFERSDGSIQYLRWEVRPWRTADGVIGGIIITTEEVTARVVAERALKGASSGFGWPLTRQIWEFGNGTSALERINGMIRRTGCSAMNLNPLCRTTALGRVAFILMICRG